LKKTVFYKKIYDELLEKIKDGTYASNDYLPSERELCDQYKVDRITVRKALELLVADGVVEKKAGIGTQVKDKKFGWMVQPDNKNVLFVLPKSKVFQNRIIDTFNATLFFTLQTEFRLRGYTLIYASISDNESIETIANGNSLCGAILVSISEGRIFNDFKQMNLPVVVVNGYNEKYTSIFQDNARGIDEAVTYLYTLGHRKIGFIAGEIGYFNSSCRYEGYVQSLKRLNLTLERRWILDGHWTLDGGYSAMEKMIHNEAGCPTALVSSNDTMAIGVIKCALRHGLSIPGDMSIIGFDNIDQCNYTSPRLTSVNGNVEMIVSAVCLHLIQAIEQHLDLKYKIVIPTELVHRDSTANV
jgi:GntR family transcriptional regulator of arabinose operon